MCYMLSQVHTYDIVDSRQNGRQIGDKVDCGLRRRFVESRLLLARLTLLICLTRSTLSKVGDFCRPNVERPLDCVASVYGTKAICLDCRQSRPCRIRPYRKCVLCAWLYRQYMNYLSCSVSIVFVAGYCRVLLC